jgi:SagB-type dehydrogenase family enzyme
MKKVIVVCLGVVAVALAVHFGLQAALSQEEPEEAKTVKLPAPKLKGEMSVEEAIKQRRCVRSYKDKALTLETLSQLLWSADGRTGEERHQRAAPSAGGKHPLDLYVVAGEGSVESLEAGIWHYEALEHSITLAGKGDKRETLENAAPGQIGSAKIDIVVTIEFARTTGKYGERGRRYAYMDCGFACENVFLEVQALGLSMCVVGAFNDDKVTEALGLPKEHEPALILTIGYPE